MDVKRPILINNWEATYFDFTSEKIIDIAKDASELGIEMLVLDDGWFGKRDDDNSGLGDWFVNEKKLDEFAARMKTCRILVNTPSSQGGIGDLYNFSLTPSLTLGCGSWGGNSVSENVGVKHLLNIKTVAERSIPVIQK